MAIALGPIAWEHLLVGRSCLWFGGAALFVVPLMSIKVLRGPIG